MSLSCTVQETIPVKTSSLRETARNDQTTHMVGKLSQGFSHVG